MGSFFRRHFLPLFWLSLFYCDISEFLLYVSPTEPPGWHTTSHSFVLVDIAFDAFLYASSFLFVLSFRFIVLETVCSPYIRTGNGIPLGIPFRLISTPDQGASYHLLRRHTPLQPSLFDGKQITFPHVVLGLSDSSFPLIRLQEIVHKALPPRPPPPPLCRGKEASFLSH